MACSEELGFPPLLSEHTLQAAIRKLPPHEQRAVAEIVRKTSQSRASLAGGMELATGGEDALTDAAPDRGTQARILQAIEEALRSGRRLRIRYDTAGRGAARDRLIEPLALGQWGPHTYVTAFCCERRDQRVFRLDRIERVEGVDGG